MKKVIVANDHGAVLLTKSLVEHLKERGYEVNYLGVKDEVSVDYPDKAREACIEFLKGGYEFGVLCCGTGIGISIAANKIKGIRCALVQNCFAAKATKEHNNSNFIAFGGRIEYQEDPIKMLDAFIDASFEGGRHQRRVDKLKALEDTPVECL